MTTMNLLLVGVGGQGTILASKIIAEVAMMQGHDVKMSEIHGMAQRGGSVVTQVRIGEKVYSPLIEEGEADFIVAFEKLEALRWVHYLREGGSIIVNDQQIDPMTVITGQRTYPPDVLESLEKHSQGVVTVHALTLAREVGNIRTVNTVLLGSLARRLGSIPKDSWIEAMKKAVPSRFLDVNLKAFEAGFND